MSISSLRRYIEKPFFPRVRNLGWNAVAGWRQGRREAAAETAIVAVDLTGRKTGTSHEIGSWRHGFLAARAVRMDAVNCEGGKP